MTVLSHFLLWRLGLAKAWTWYPREECASLEKFARGKKRLVEIGCWQGVNTARLRKVMAPEGLLTAVDPYPKGRLGFNAAEIIARAETEKIQNGCIRWFKMTDLEAAQKSIREKEELYDFIFSDSDNSYEGFQKTWEAWSPLLAPGGIYILANSQPVPGRIRETSGSVRFTHEKIISDPRFKTVEIVGAFTILKKTAQIHA